MLIEDRTNTAIDRWLCRDSGIRLDSLNRLTIAKFERLCTVNCFLFPNPSKALPLLEGLITLLGSERVFIAFVVYELAAP